MMQIKKYLLSLVFALFIGLSFLLHFLPGIRMGRNFLIFAKDMILILPPAFILIGLFDVWAKRETIEKHFGQSAGIMGFTWAILLAATTVGGTFVAFPVANSLYHKGARLSLVIAYITAASLLMIPMSIMEAAILGPKFTAIRIGVSLPLVVISSLFLEKVLIHQQYSLPLDSSKV